MQRLTFFSRLTSLFAFASVVVLGGCKEPAGTNAQALVIGSQDVVLKGVQQFADPNDAHYVYYVCQIKWTNPDTDMVPRIERFVLIDHDQNRYPGMESGAVALVGITNYEGTVVHGASHDYTIGYHVLVNTVGSIYYDNT
jgi:hypothetical protein